MNCPKCGAENPDSGHYCVKCGQPLDAPEAAQVTVRERVFCSNCGKPNDKGSNFCRWCRHPLTAAAIQKMQQEQNVTAQQMQLAMQAKQLELQQQQLNLQAAQMAGQMRCPRCGSTSLSGNKKGYGIGKGLVGAAALTVVSAGALAPLGLMAGNIGAKKVRITCMKCGKQFWAGR